MADVVDTWSYGDQNTKDWLHDGDVERSAADIIDTAENVAALGEQITAAAAQAVQDVNAAGSEQMAAIEGVTASQVAIVEAAGTAQAAAVAAEGASQIVAIDDKASDVIDSIQETVQEQAMSLLEAAIDAQETAIANAGTAQIAAIDAEGAALVADAEAARDDAVSAKDAALAAQTAAETESANAAESEAAALAAANSASANASAAGVSAANAETAATQAAAAADAAMSVTDFDKYQHVNTKAWANTVDYSPGAIVTGSDGNLYVALQASGPSSTAVNPVGDASGRWEMLANLVHRSGNETIAGTKTVTDTVIFSTTIALQRNVDTNYMRIMGGTSTSNGAYIDLHGENHTNYEGRFRIYAKKTGLSPTQHSLVGTPDGNLTWDGNAIQTSSDERLKTDFDDVPQDVLDAWEAVQWQQFRFLAAKEIKGEDARWHTGLVAQRVKDIFEGRGLDACAYGILCHEQWEDEYEEREDGSRVLVRAAGEMWTIRYEEALAMEAIYQRRRADRAEARIAAMERRLNEMESALASLIAPVGDETYAGSEEGNAE